ncbi:unnamed protein product [Mycena citricolor]|uniref:Carboxypeptidase n=1 Tax=Mycena citricolor TaxID=2018698 RepID=A0AAD2JZ18_9AGAR|nr:unnamed protein product [Mycena citricolor]
MILHRGTSFLLPRRARDRMILLLALVSSLFLGRCSSQSATSSYPHAYPGIPNGSYGPNWQHYFEVTQTLPNVSTTLSRSYAGNVAVDRPGHPNDTLFFWAFEKSNGSLIATSTTDPWIIWLNGGPGASSLLGFMEENGPLRIQPDSSMAVNNYSWHKLADTFWIDQPVGVGFSTADTTGYVVDEDQMAEDFVCGPLDLPTGELTTVQTRFLANLVKIFPSLAKRPLYLMGESYAGTYIPYITKALFSTSHPPVNLKKMVVGDGTLGSSGIFENLPTVRLTDYLRTALISSQLTTIETYPQLIGYDTDVYQFFKTQSHLCGYDINLTYPQNGPFPTYQYPTQTGSSQRDPSKFRSRLATSYIKTLASGITHQPKQGEVRSWENRKRDLSGRANGTIDPWYECFIFQEMWDYAFNFTFPWKLGGTDVYDIPDGLNPEVTLDPTLFFNAHDVRSALHAPTSKDWSETINYPFKADANNANSFGDPSPEPMVFLSELATNASARGNMTFGGIQGFTRRPSTPFFDDNGGYAGIVHQERNLTFALFKGAGHLVPRDQPAAIYAFVREFVLGSNTTGLVTDSGVIGGEDASLWSGDDVMAGSVAIFYGNGQNGQTTASVVAPSATIATWNAFMSIAFVTIRGHMSVFAPKTNRPGLARHPSKYASSMVGESGQGPSRPAKLDGLISGKYQVVCFWRTLKRLERQDLCPPTRALSKSLATMNITSPSHTLYDAAQLSSASWLEQQWAAWYMWVGNPVLATGLMSFLLHEIVYFGRCVPWIIVDAIPYFRRWKLQPNKIPSAKEQWDCTKQVLYSHFMVELPVIWLFHPMAEAFGMRTYEIPFPHWKEMLPQVGMFFVFEDMFHFFAHSALHYGALYKHIHKVHHKYSAPFGLAAEYAHPAEVAILGAGTIGGPVIYCMFTNNLHIVTVYIWIVLKLFQAVDAHNFPWSLQHILPFWSGAEHHDFHHMAFTNNYATSFRWCDRLFGTDDKYRAYRARVEAAKKAMKNASKAEHDELERKLMAEVEAEGLPLIHDPDLPAPEEGKAFRRISQRWMDPSAPLTNGNGIDHQPSPTPATVPLDPEIFRAYFRGLLPPVIGANPGDVEALFDETFDDRVAKFASEPNATLYVVKSKLDTEEEIEDESLLYEYVLASQLTYHPSHVTTLALMKRSPVLDPSAPLGSQIHFLNLFGGEETPYESLHAIVSFGVKPWFESFVGARGASRDSGDSKMGIPMTRKKFAELELSLLHLQQNVEIPETHLAIHPVIQRAVEQTEAAGTRPSINDIPPHLLNDSTFLNSLHANVNSWIKSIQAVTKLTRDVTSGTASQEINFWLSLEHELEGIDTQLQSKEVNMVMECLRNAKRFRATVSFLADTGLKDAMDLVHKYNQLMKDLPLNELLSATDLAKIDESIGLIFGHINKKLKLSPYPIRRALPLVEAISRDFNDQLLRILTSQRLAYTPYETFDRLLGQVTAIFRKWDDLIKEFMNVAREAMRKRAERFIPIKLVNAHAKLQERTRYLRDWRKQHEQLAVMTAPTRGIGGNIMDMGIGGMDMEEEVKEAYEIVKRIDVLDVSIEGTEIWVTAENAYNERVARVENQIIARLRDRLGTARNANEMFRVFSKFNALFVRPKFKTRFRDSEASHMSQMRDLPAIASAIIWARQIERQLLTYMKRVEDVLGKGWELYAEGQKLQSESSAFRKKLDTRPVYDAWLHDINRRNMGVDGRLFEIIRPRGGAALYQLAVNFDPQIITLFKEVRNLLWLGFQVPHAITNMAKDAKRVYPHAVSLMETVRTYGQTLDLVEENKGIEWLVAEYRNESQRMIGKGMNIKWDYFVNQYDSTARYSTVDGRDNRHIQFVREFASVISVLQDKTNNVIDLYKDILRAVEDLASCSFTTEAFSELLGKVQTAIDQLNLGGYANLDQWVAELDKRIEGILLQRLVQIVQVWCDQFDRTADDSDLTSRNVLRDITNKRRGDKRQKEEKFLEANMMLIPVVHEIRIQNQVIFLDPPIEHARANWIRQLHDWFGVVCRLRRIQSSRYEIGLQMQGSHVTETNYTALLRQLPEHILQRPFALIESKVQQLTEYVGKWLQFQSLWDLEADYVFNRLGDSLGHWQQLLTEIKKTRSTFDTSETQKSFGVCIVDYEQVQAKVNAKYDSWQRDILSRFGVKLGNAMKEMHASILKARNDLEHHSIEGLTGGARRF